MGIAEKLITIAENEQKVYDAGIEQGKRSAYDEFWDSYQSNGNRGDYRNAFSGVGWTTETFKPIHSMKPTMANGIFTYSNVTADLGEILKEQNVSIDFSMISNADQMFHESKFTALPVIDLSGVRLGSFYLTFSYLNATKIEKVILKEDGSQSFNSTFVQSSKLAEVIFEGVIGQSLSLSSSPLNRTSIESIISCLSDTATGKTLTLKKTAKEAAFTAEEWATLIGTKSNWTISLV